VTAAAAASPTGAVAVDATAGLEPGQRDDYDGEYGDKPKPAETALHEKNPRGYVPKRRSP
jgi:hypothetical protein